MRIWYQPSISPEKFDLPFSGKLSPENRWVIMAKIIPWEEFEGEYAEKFSTKIGTPAKPFRMALGALIIQKKLGTSDRETEHLLGKGIKIEYLNDDKIGRVMDKLYQKGLSKIFTMTAIKAVQKYGVLKKQSHLDASSISLSGNYNIQEEEEESKAEEKLIDQPIKIVKGYSRDNRPDLKQFVINLICSNDGDIPLYFEGGDGNQSDKAKFTSIIKRFKNQVNLDSLIIVNSALFSQENLKILGITPWLCRVPLTVKEAKKLVSKIPLSELIKSKIPQYSWSVQESNYSGIAQRWLIVESEKRKESDLKKLEKNINKEYKQATRKIRQLSQSSFEHKSCLNQGLKSLEKSLKYHRLSNLKITEVAKKKTNKEKSSLATNVSYTLKVFLEQEPEAIKLYQRRAGRFILATNILEEEELTADEMLSKYKEQQSTERGFRFIKDPLFFADSVFLKSPQRIETMTMLMGLCLLVYTIGQRQLRQKLKECKTGLKNQLGKLTNN